MHSREQLFLAAELEICVPSVLFCIDAGLHVIFLR